MSGNIKEPGAEVQMNADKKPRVLFSPKKIKVSRSLTAQKERIAPATTLTQDILHLLLKIAIILMALFLLFTFMFGIHRTTDNSMSPAIQEGDLVIFYRFDKNYAATDTLILDYNGTKQVRRVIAVAGDVVDIVESGLVINGSLVQEPNIYQDTLRYTDGVSFPLTVGPEQVFVLGDGRKDSVDSRLYGVVNIRDVFGKVMTIIRRRNI